MIGALSLGAPALVGCDKGGGDEATGESEAAALDIEVALSESSVSVAGEPGESVAKLTIKGRTATLDWTHTGALADSGMAPPTGEVELSDAQLERIGKILDKTGLGQSDVVKVEQVDDPRVRVSGSFGGDDGHEVDILLGTATPLTERPAEDDTAVFTVEATRALLGEIARMLTTDE